MQCSNHHHKLINGHGKCSVPMWMNGCPAGFCDNPAYGERPDGKTWRNAHTGELHRYDGKYNGYVPGLACHVHGGPELKELAHKGDPCEFCNVPHNDVLPGPCRALVDPKILDDDVTSTNDEQSEELR